MSSGSGDDITLDKTSDWEVSSGYGTLNLPVGSTFAKSTTDAMAFSTTSPIYPNSNTANAIIDASSTGWD